jgi:hypothetical protein
LKKLLKKSGCIHTTWVLGTGFGRKVCVYIPLGFWVPDLEGKWARERGKGKGKGKGKGIGSQGRERETKGKWVWERERDRVRVAKGKLKESGCG